ncbi:MAG: Ig-like domain-containing protein [Owenweeksia sp.]
MKVSIKSLAMFAMVGVMGVTACKKDDDGGSSSNPSVSSIMANDKDLYGSSSAVDVATDATIVIEFNENIDESTKDAVKLIQGSSEVASTVTVSGATVTIVPNEKMFGGTSYSLEIDGLKASSGSSVGKVSVLFTTAGIGLDTAPKSSSQMVYLQLDGNYLDVAGNATEGDVVKNTWTTDRFGNADGAAMLNGATAIGNGDIIEMTGTDFIYANTTISAWFKADFSLAKGSPRLLGLGAEKGYFFEISDQRAWCKFATNHSVIPDPNNHYFATNWADPNGDGSSTDETTNEFEYEGDIASIIKDNDWNQVVMSFDASTARKKIFVNGVKLMDIIIDDPDNTEWNLRDMALADKADGTGDPLTGIEGNLALGNFASPGNTYTSWADYDNTDNTFNGAIDDVRIWSVALTDNDIIDLYNAEKP